MRVLKIKRAISQNKKPILPADCRRLREFARSFFAGENHWEFAIEALIFGALLTISAWPIVAAAGAIKELL
jgi:hypothetical protein